MQALAGSRGPAGGGASLGGGEAVEGPVHVTRNLQQRVSQTFHMWMSQNIDVFAKRTVALPHASKNQSIWFK